MRPPVSLSLLCPIRYITLSPLSLRVVDRDDLVDPADEGGDLDVHSRDVFPAAPKSPGHEAGQFVVAGVLADKGASSVTLKHNGTLEKWQQKIF